MNKKTDIKLILIGPLPDLKSGKIGGARVSFQILVTYCKEKNIEYNIINTQTYSGSVKSIINPFLVLTKLTFRLPKSNLVFVNVSQNGIKYLVPLVYILVRLFGKKIAFRPFGGSLVEEYLSYHFLNKYFFKSLTLKSDLVFLQTRKLISYFKSMATRIEWLPTSRNKSSKQRSGKSNYNKRFVYLGHIKESKGIDLIMKLNQELKDTGFTFHMYGPIKETKYQGLSPNIYGGILNNSEVMEKLYEYDVLLLPTYFYGEGYPGAIIEAYSLGIPVISTLWKSIPEIVIDGETGFLVEPKSYEKLKSIITSIDQDKWAYMSEKALDYFEKNHDSEVVNDRIFGILKSII